MSKTEFFVNYVLGNLKNGITQNFEPTDTNRVKEAHYIINKTVEIINAAIDPKAAVAAAEAVAAAAAAAAVEAGDPIDPNQAANPGVITSEFLAHFRTTINKDIYFSPLTPDVITLIPYTAGTTDCSDFTSAIDSPVDPLKLQEYNIRPCRSGGVTIHTGNCVNDPSGSIDVGEDVGMAVLYQVSFTLVQSGTVAVTHDMATQVIERSLYITGSDSAGTGTDLNSYLCADPAKATVAQPTIVRAKRLGPATGNEVTMRALNSYGDSSNLSDNGFLASIQVNSKYSNAHTLTCVEVNNSVTSLEYNLIFNNLYALAMEEIEFIFKILWKMETFKITPTNVVGGIYNINIVSNSFLSQNYLTRVGKSYDVDIESVMKKELLDNAIRSLMYQFFGRNEDDVIDDNDNNIISYFECIHVVNAPICFPAGTLIQTDHGEISIENIDIKIHTINNKSIIEITKTISSDKYLVYFKKHALGYNIPNKKTIMTKEHRILLNNELIEANDLVENKNVKKIKYNGELLYNVLMDNHEVMNVNNLVCETLHPASYLGIKLFNGEPKSFTILKKFGNIFNTVNNLNN